MDALIRDFLSEIVALAWSLSSIDTACRLTDRELAPDIEGTDGVWIEVKTKHETQAERDLWDQHSIPIPGGRLLNNAPPQFDGNPADPESGYARALTRHAADAATKFANVGAAQRLLFIRMELDFIGGLFIEDRFWETLLPAWARANSAHFDRIVICDRWDWAQPRLDLTTKTKA